jgi:hypothetical protein
MIVKGHRQPLIQGLVPPRQPSSWGVHRAPATLDDLPVRLHTIQHFAAERACRMWRSSTTMLAQCSRLIAA